MEGKKVHISKTLDFRCVASKRGPLLLYVGTEEFSCYTENTDPFSKHSHQFTEIMYVAKGELTFTFNYTKHTLHANDVLIIPSGVSHMEAWQGEDCRYYIACIAHFPTDKFYTQENFILRNTPHNERIAFYLKNILLEVSEKQEDYKTVVHGLFSCLIHELQRNHRQISQSVQVLPTPANSIAETIQTYIHQHYEEEIRLADFCRITFFSEQYLIKKFKESFGITPTQYLLRIRIQNAGYFLLKRDNSISQIGSKVGFHSHLAFLYTFKKLLGLTPTQFREKYKENIKQGFEACTFIKL